MMWHDASTTGYYRAVFGRTTGYYRAVFGHTTGYYHAVGNGLSNLQNALSLFLGRRRISKGSPFQVEGPTMENARRCLVAALARGTNSWPVTEERRARRPGRPDTGL